MHAAKRTTCVDSTTLFNQLKMIILIWKLYFSAQKSLNSLNVIVILADATLSPVKSIPLAEAIDIERNLLGPIANAADLCLDTTHTNVHQLRAQVKERILRRKPQELSILFQSFGFKHSVPTDSDYVFDVRCLPNPHWEIELRPLTGQDPEVQAFLEQQEDVIDMFHHIRNMLEHWIPKFAEQNRYYLTISIGCTGGQHRSVYMAELLSKYFRTKYTNVALRHREMT